MSKQNGKHFSASVNVDTALLEKFSAILAVDSHDAKLVQIQSFIASSTSNGSLTKLLSNWSFYSTSNDHSAFIELSVKLSKFTHLINVASASVAGSASDSPAATPAAPSSSSISIAFLEVKSTIIDFYKDLINNHTKVIYRSLNNNRAPLTNPVLRILNNAVSFGHGLLVDDFVDAFDFNLSVLPKLLVPFGATGKDAPGGGGSSGSTLTPSDPAKDHLSIRFNFIKFWLTLTSLASPLTRKDLLAASGGPGSSGSSGISANTSKIMNNIWKYMADSDSLPTVRSILEFIDKSILSEPTFKKSTKCRILSENFMFKIQLLYNRVGSTAADEAFSKFFVEFMDKLVSDPKNGLTYPNDRPWESASASSNGGSSSSSGASSGAPIVLNNKSFRINNKLIYTLLTTLKPWEANTQLQLVVKILESNLELVPPYMNWIVQSGGGYHDPSLSSWWVGHTLLFNNILQLPLPHDIHSQIVDVKLVAENICLAPLSKGSIIKCLKSPNNLVKQFASQLVYLQLAKVSKVLATLGNQRQEFIENIFTNLPEEAVFFAAYKEVPADLKLLKLTLIMILNKYEQLDSFSAGSGASGTSGLLKHVNEEINTLIDSTAGTGSSLKGTELVMLDNFLSITSQQGDDSDFKWWNKSATTGNSFFTSLIKLSATGVAENDDDSSRDNSLAFKNFQLLENLTSSSLVFNKDLVVSPIFALVQSNPRSERVWKLLDETISRSVRAPFKYLDLSHGKYQDISLFVVVFFEQLRFVLKGGECDSKDAESFVEWLFDFLKYLIVIGEPRGAIVELVNEFANEDAKFKKIVESKNLLQTLESNGQEGRNNGTSFFDYIAFTSNDSIKKEGGISRIPVNSFDIAGLIFRLKLLVQESESDSNWADNIIIDLVTKLGSYLLGVLPEDKHLAKFITSKKFFGSLLVKDADDFESNKKKILASGLINEVFQQLPIKVETGEFNQSIYELFQLGCQETLSQEKLSFIVRFSWVLTNEQLHEIIKGSKSIFLTSLLCEKAIERGLPVEGTVVSEIIKSSVTASASIIKIIESNRVSYSEELLKTQIDEILSLPQNHYLLKPFIAMHPWVKTYLIKKASTISDASLLCYIGFSIVSNSGPEKPKDDASTVEKDELVTFFEKILPVVFESEDLPWDHVLSVYATCLQYQIISTPLKEEILSRTLAHIQETPKDGFVAEFACFVYHLVAHTSQTTQEVEEWLHKAVLYITKKLAISTTISARFHSFISEIERIVQFLPTIGTTIWKCAPIAILNTQLEVIFQHKLWSRESFILKYCNSVVTTASRNIIQFEKLLQILINNSDLVLKDLPSKKSFSSRFQTALIILKLFEIDVRKNSTSTVLNKLLSFYSGSIRAEDLIMKRILIQIESNLSFSWISQVHNWEFSEELTNEEIEIVGDEERLITQDKKGLVVTLSKNFVKNSNENLQKQQQQLEEASRLLAKSEVQFGEFNFLFVNQEYSKTIYDPEFLMMLIINNDELVKIDKEKSHLDVKKFVDFNLLQFVVNCLAIPSVAGISKVILQGVVKSCNEPEYSFKDKNIYKVFASNILNTLRKTPASEIPSIIWYLHGSIVSILLNPGHFLYERAFRYVLSHPKIKPNYIPMFSSITMSLSSDAELEGEDSHFKQVAWLLQNIWHGTTNTSDLNILKLGGVIEWCLNLINTPYISMRIRALIFKVLYKIQSIDEGSDLLITRFGVLTSLEQQLLTVEKIGSTLKAGTGVYNELIEEQLSINIDELVLRLGVSVGSNKRIKNWTGDDMKKYTKRVHREVKEEVK